MMDSRVISKMLQGFSTKNLSELISISQSSLFNLNLPFHFISAHALVEASLSENLLEILNQGRLICDSKPLSKYLSRNFQVVPHIRGTDFMRNFLLQAPKGSRHYFMGSTEQVLEQISIYLEKNRKSQLISKFMSPEFGSPWDSISSFWIDDIRKFKPNYVWVGMGAPKQFIIAHDIFRKVGVQTFSVGAAFDFIAKNKKESPRWISNLGFEWLFRLISEPRRLWKRYLLGNIRFIILITRIQLTRIRNG